MDAREYFVKLMLLCRKHDGKRFGKCCPMSDYCCIAPDYVEEINSMLDIIENVNLDDAYPFGYCRGCGYEFNSELIRKYEIKYCPQCGVKVVETKKTSLAVREH